VLEVNNGIADNNSVVLACHFRIAPYLAAKPRLASPCHAQAVSPASKIIVCHQLPNLVQEPAGMHG
jgi:hypothetical protein